MANVYYRIDNSDSSNIKKYYTNEAKPGYELWEPNFPPASTIYIELYLDAFILPNNSSNLFYKAKNTTFNNMGKWDTSNVTDMKYMFAYCTSLTSLNLSNFDTSNVTDMTCMFLRCSGLTSLNVSSFDTSNVTNMAAMFASCNKLTSLDLSNFNTPKVTDGMSEMFKDCTSLTSLDLSSFNTLNVTNMQFMFETCTNLKTIYASEFFDTTKVTDSYRMFRDCNSLVGGNGTIYNPTKTDKEYARIDKGVRGYFTRIENIYYKVDGDICYFSNVQGMGFTKWTVPSSASNAITKNKHVRLLCDIPGSSGIYLPSNAARIFAGAIDIDHPELINITAITSLLGMFENSAIDILNLRRLNLTQITNVSDMFKNCRSLKKVYFYYKPSNCSYFNNMFYNCDSLEEILVKRYTDWKKAAYSTAKSTNMFYNCYLLPNFDSTEVNLNRANVSQTGYFSLMYKLLTPYVKTLAGWKSAIESYIKTEDGWQLVTEIGVKGVI